MIMSLKQPHSLQPPWQSSHRLKRSRQMETVASLHAQKNSSCKNFVNSSLGNTDTSRWISSSCKGGLTHTISRGEKIWSDQLTKDDGPLKLPGSGRIAPCQQLHKGNHVKINNRMPHSINGENSDKRFTQELSSPSEENVLFQRVPLSFDDVLERKNVKVLTPRTAKGYEGLPIASETFPVVYDTEGHQHQPFSSPGFHSLDPPEPLLPSLAVKESKVRSTILDIPESVQVGYMLHYLRERSYAESGTKTMKTRAHGVNLHVLLADGNVVRSPNLGHVLLNNQGGASVASSRDSLISFSTTRNKSMSSAFGGHVLNGMNPTQTWNAGKMLRTSSKPLHGSPRRRLGNKCQTSAWQSQKNWAANFKNKVDLMLSSKQVMCSQNGMSTFAAMQSKWKKDWYKKTTALSKIAPMSHITENVELHGMSFSRPNSRVNSADEKFRVFTDPMKETVIVNSTGASSGTIILSTDARKTSEIKHRPQPIHIHIPTAENMN